jgi:hypothetical protein
VLPDDGGQHPDGWAVFPAAAKEDGVSNTDRAHQNSEYVRRLLKMKWPEFAAVLERVVGELTCTCDAPSAESPGPSWLTAP